MKQQKPVCIVFLVTCACILVVYHRNQEAERLKTPRSLIQYGQQVPLTSLAKGTAPLNIFSSSNDQALSLENGALRIKYTKGKVSGESGGSFQANPYNKFPVDACTLSYSVYLPPSFNFQKGGKMPGVCLGTDLRGCATGGEWSPIAGSVRVMWKEEGAAIAYVYAAIQGNKEATMRMQGPQYQNVTDAHLQGDSGHAVWLKKDLGMKFKKGWNTVNLTVVLNTPGLANGMLVLTVNGVKRLVQDVMFRTSASVRINSLNMVSFYGGNSSTWAVPNDTYALFKDIRILA